MKRFILEHKEELENFCRINCISIDKVLKSPKCYTNNVMYIQQYDKTNTGKGLNNDTTANILLTIRRRVDNQGLIIIPSSDMRKYLS